MLGAIPFFHVYGMTVAMLFSMYTGAELIVTPDPRQTDLVLEILQARKGDDVPRHSYYVHCDSQPSQS